MASKPPGGQGNQLSWPCHASEWKGLCANQRKQSLQHLWEKCQGVNIWKPQLSARSLFEKEHISKQMPGKRWGQGLQELEVQLKKKFQILDSSLPRQKGKRKRGKRSTRGSRLLPRFPGELRGQMLQGYWSQCQMWERSVSDMSWEVTKHRSAGVAKSCGLLPNEAVVSTHLNTSEEVMKTSQEGWSLFCASLSQGGEIMLPTAELGVEIHHSSNSARLFFFLWPFTVRVIEIFLFHKG